VTVRLSTISFSRFIRIVFYQKEVENSKWFVEM